MSIATKRLLQERREWRKDHPPGFVAKFAKTADGNGQDIFKWECKIPGKTGLLYDSLLMFRRPLGNGRIFLGNGIQ